MKLVFSNFSDQEKILCSYISQFKYITALLDREECLIYNYQRSHEFSRLASVQMS